MALAGGVAAYAATLAVVFFLTTIRGIAPTSIVGLLLNKGIAQFALGAAFVYSGARFAPSHHVLTLFCLAGLVLLFSGAGLFASFLVGPGWGTVEAVATLLGAGTVVWRQRAAHDEDISQIRGRW